VPEVAEEVGVPKVLEGVVIEKAAFASTGAPGGGDLNTPVECSQIQVEPPQRGRLRNISRKTS
jgi:hypothetical protein